MRVYLLVFLVASCVTYLTTPIVRQIALSMHALTPIRARDVHTNPIPRLGGVAMFAGLFVSFIVASNIPFLTEVFRGYQAWAVLVGSGIVCVLGVIDDIWELDWITKICGQILTAGVMAWMGIEITSFPIYGLTIGSSKLSLFATIFIVILAINAVNFVDGLDGLAAGLISIGCLGFFIYSYLLTRVIGGHSYASLASVVIVSLLGVCIGFLPYNFNPATIFMGDCGSMILGLVTASATILITGQINPAIMLPRQTFAAFIPILLPLAVMIIPLVDMLMAIVRRLRAGKSPFHADRMHIHHKLLRLGYSHRHVVLVMYLWGAVISFGACSLLFLSMKIWGLLWVPMILGVFLYTLISAPALHRRLFSRIK